MKHNPAMMPIPEGRRSENAAARIDAHVHLMSFNAEEHDWVTDDLSSRRRDFLLKDLRPHLAEAGFDGCVAVLRCKRDKTS